MISFKSKGDFKKTQSFLEKAKRLEIQSVLERYGSVGVSALSSATPVESGATASAWYYEVSIKRGAYTITFFNSNVNKGVPIAIILQYGHGTGNGGWVNGRDYINPSIQPVFDEIVEEAWKEVTKL